MKTQPISKPNRQQRNGPTFSKPSRPQKSGTTFLINNNMKSLFESKTPNDIEPLMKSSNDMESLIELKTSNDMESYNNTMESLIE